MRPNSLPNYAISPVYTDESDVDLSDDDPSYVHNMSNYRNKQKNFFIASSSESLSSCDSDVSNTEVKRGRKRIRDTSKWKQNKAKRLRNSGRPYTSVSKNEKNVPGRCLQPPCTQKCKYRCANKITTDTRYQIFTNYWNLGDLNQQRAFIKSSMVDIKPRYQYTNAENPRKPNKAYYFTIDNQQIRVCKTFFKGTLNISDRMIFTTQQKTNENNFLEEDLRGKHGNHKKNNPDLLKDIRDHINSIPRMESHYVRATTSKEYIDGGKTIKDLYDDFKQIQSQNKKDVGNYMTYYKIFTKEFNISFFRPKKDMCDLCMSYENSTADQKRELQEKYDQHHEEKILTRNEKKADRKNITDNNKVVIYDLQAVLQCPRGDSSAFYYKSKLNSYNLTVTELSKPDKKGAYDNVHSYFWTESDAKRGAIEIGTCVWKYLEEVSKDAKDPLNIIFYSDNCAGQNKNKFIMTMYMYAVHLFNIQSITHKFLIRGHTQNEADNIHSLIEKEVKKNLKSGPIYTPVQYITLIKNAKKCNPPINVHELTYDSIIDFKLLQQDWGFNYGTDENGHNVNWNEVKVLKVTKENPFLFYYKTSYKDENFKEVNVRNKRRKMKSATEISLSTAYTQRQEISANKKKDLKELMAKNLIPSYYASFYNSIL